MSIGLANHTTRAGKLLQPERTRAAAMAEASLVRDTWSIVHGAEPLDPIVLARDLRWSVHVVALDAPRRGLQAALVPQTTGFSIVVDPRPTPGPQEQLALDVLLKLRIAHELGHTLFYDLRRDKPRRVDNPCAAEEEFCDVFAGQALGTSGAEREMFTNALRVDPREISRFGAA